MGKFDHYFDPEEQKRKSIEKEYQIRKNGFDPNRGYRGLYHAGVVLLILLAFLLVAIAWHKGGPAEKELKQELTGGGSPRETFQVAQDLKEEMQDLFGAKADSSENADPADTLSAEYTAVIRCIDVGQGNATLIESGDCKVLIDTGKNDYQVNRLPEYLKEIGVDHLDYLVLTHPHEDHTGYAERLSALYYPIGTLLIPNLPEDLLTSEKQFDYLHLFEHGPFGRTEIINPKPGDMFSFGTMTATILTPTPEMVDKGIADAKKSGESYDLNEASIGMLITQGDFSFLIYGDGETETEQQILATGMLNDNVDVLSVAHHGSDSSTCEELLGAISSDGKTPQAAIISVGAENPYGHPAQPVLDRLNLHGFDIYRTDKDRNIQIGIKEDGSYNIYSN